MPLDSTNRNDLSRFVPSVMPADASAKVIADIEGLGRRFNALLNRQNLNTGKITTIVNAPPQGGGGGNGISGSLGPVATHNYSNGLFVGGSNVIGTNAQILIWNGTTTTWEAKTMSGDATISAAGALTLASIISAGSAGSATQVPVITWDAKGRLTVVTTATITGTVPNGTVSGQILTWNGSAWVAVAMSGDATIAASGALTLASIISASSAGSATSIPVITWDAKGRLTVVSTASISDRLPAAGTVTNSTLRWNGTNWVESTFLTSSTSQVVVNATVGAAGTAAVIPFQVKIAGNASFPDAIEAVAQNSTDLAAIAIINAATSAGVRWGLAGATNDFATGTAAGDAAMNLVGDKRFWFSVNNGVRMILDEDGLVMGATSAAGARLDITAAASQIAALFTGASSQIAAKIIATSATPALYVTNTTAPALWLSSSVAIGAASGAQMQIATTQTIDAASRRLGAINFGMDNSGAAVTGAGMSCLSAEAWTLTTNQGAHLSFYTTNVGAASVTAKLRIHADGDIWINATGSALSTSATKGFGHWPNCAGVPTGTPANLSTGATPSVFDTTHNTRFYWATGTSTWVTSKWRLIINNYVGTGSSTTKTMDALTDYQTADTAAGGTVGVTLPDAATRGSAPVWVKSIVGGIANVTVNRAGSDTIDGGTTGITLTAGQRACLVANGTDWQRIGA